MLCMHLCYFFIYIMFDCKSWGNYLQQIVNYSNSSLKVIIIEEIIKIYWENKTSLQELFNPCDIHFWNNLLENQQYMKAFMQKGRISNFGRFSFFAGSSKFLADWIVLTWIASFRDCFGRFALRSPEITYAKKLSFPLETETRSADFFFLFFICLLDYFKNQNIYLKKTGSQSCYK